MADLPLIMTAAGPIPTAPATLRALLLSTVAASVPGYTANLPSSMIEDISSTSVGALTLLDTSRVETVNSISPKGANPFILKELGQMLGVPIGGSSNTSVFVVFSGPPGYLIPKGFTVGDGTYQYIVQDGGAIGSGGDTQPLFCRATIQGSWVVPPGTVSNLVTSVPSPIVVTCTNPESGTPGQATGESETQYRARVLQANLAASQGMPRYLKTLLGQVSGVQVRLISVRLVDDGWQILCGGGDPYDVANAIFQSLFDISDLVGSTTDITAITKANPAQVTTDINHGLVTGQDDVEIAGALGMTAINGGPYTVTVVDEKTFTLNGVDSTGYATYTGGGEVTPNNRTIEVSINDYPDTYIVPYVNSPQQTVTLTATWNTDSPNIINPAAIAQLAAPALVDYINSIAAGQPINVLEMISVFQLAISPILPTPLLSRLVFAVNINGILTPPVSGTGLINGDPESFFFAVSSGIVVQQG